MSETGGRGASTASLGLANVELFAGDFAAGDTDEALKLADILSKNLPPQPRAYAALIEANLVS